MSSVVGPKGQVTIDASIRKRLGVEPGWRALQMMEGQRVVMHFVPPRHCRSLFGCLAVPPPDPFPTDDMLNQVREEAWAKIAAEEYAEERVGEGLS